MLGEAEWGGVLRLRRPPDKWPAWTEMGGLPRPPKAPERERAGFWTAIICPPLADKT